MSNVRARTSTDAHAHAAKRYKTNNEPNERTANERTSGKPTSQDMPTTKNQQPTSKNQQANRRQQPKTNSQQAKTNSQRSSRYDLFWVGAMLHTQQPATANGARGMTCFGLAFFFHIYASRHPTIRVLGCFMSWRRAFRERF